MTFVGIVLGKKWEPDVSGLQNNGKTGNGIGQPIVSPRYGLASPLSAFLRDRAWGIHSLTPALGRQPLQFCPGLGQLTQGLLGVCEDHVGPQLLQDL